ncbi:MAG: saccharopine dehydrogenase family protein [Sandaracinaceae bacterium]
MSGRSFDLVVFGATGYTGGLIAEYLAEHAPPATRWAIAGRDRDKVDRAGRRLRGSPCPPRGAVLADASDPAAMRALAARTRVLLSTVGPFDLVGDGALDACVAEGTDYVDIAGEPRFVDRAVRRHHAEAEALGLKLIPCCGFDSVPHDLGVLFTLAQLPRGVPVKVEGFVRMRIPISGSTWRSAVQALSTYREHRAWRRRHRPPPPPGRRIRGLRPYVRWERAIRGWACPLPTIDPQVILRSARLIEDYGPDFRYGHYVRVHRLPTVMAGLAGVGALFTLAQARPTRELLMRLREPGAGPTEAQRARGWFRVTFVGRAGGRRVLTEVTGGDPGYGETSKMAAEAALCLAHRRHELPERAGLLTPASGLGWPYLQRLQEIGIGFRVVGSATAVRRGGSSRGGGQPAEAGPAASEAGAPRSSAGRPDRGP